MKATMAGFRDIEGNTMCKDSTDWNPDAKPDKDVKLTCGDWAQTLLAIAIDEKGNTLGKWSNLDCRKTVGYEFDANVGQGYKLTPRSRLVTTALHMHPVCCGGKRENIRCGSAETMCKDPTSFKPDQKLVDGSTCYQKDSILLSGATGDDGTRLGDWSNLKCGETPAYEYKEEKWVKQNSKFEELYTVWETCCGAKTYMRCQGQFGDWLGDVFTGQAGAGSVFGFIVLFIAVVAAIAYGFWYYLKQQKENLCEVQGIEPPGVNIQVVDGGSRRASEAFQRQSQRRASGMESIYEAPDTKRGSGMGQDMGSMGSSVMAGQGEYED